MLTSVRHPRTSIVVRFRHGVDALKHVAAPSGGRIAAVGKRDGPRDTTPRRTSIWVFAGARLVELAVAVAGTGTNARRLTPARKA
jgi:hypothetical protein